MVVPTFGESPAAPRLRVEPETVLVTAFKPGDDSKSRIIRLFNASGRGTQATVHWSAPSPQSLWLSNAGEKPIRQLNGPIEVPAWGVVTLRAESSAEK